MWNIDLNAPLNLRIIWSICGMLAGFLLLERITQHPHINSQYILQSKCVGTMSVCKCSPSSVSREVERLLLEVESGKMYCALPPCCVVLSFLSESGSGEVAAGSGKRQVYRALLPQWVGKWRAARCTMLSFHVASGRRCADDVPRVGSLLPCVGYTSVQRVISGGSWFPVEESAAKWASWAHSSAVPPAESAACCVTPLRDEWVSECWLSNQPTKVLTKGGDLRGAQVDVPWSV
jgi:hypothetical protein